MLDEDKTINNTTETKQHYKPTVGDFVTVLGLVATEVAAYWLAKHVFYISLWIAMPAAFVLFCFAVAAILVHFFGFKYDLDVKPAEAEATQPTERSEHNDETERDSRRHADELARGNWDRTSPWYIHDDSLHP